jgi:Ca-activated chloride channel homolog
MSRIRTILSIALSAALYAACDEPPPDKVPPLGARVELASGDVWLVADKAKTRLISGALLPESAQIAVGDGSRALVRLGNGAGVFLRAGSEAALGADRIALKTGELWADLPDDERALGRFTAGGVTVTASGTGMDLRLAGDATTVYVARGLAVVEAPGGRTEVADGEQVVVAGKAAPVRKPVAFWEDWTGGMADQAMLAGAAGRAAGRIYAIDRDRPGSAPEELQVSAQSVRIRIRDGVAFTTVDQRFFNPSSEPREGWYWFSVPEGAAVERFAMEVNGALVDGEMIERKQAAAAYEAAVEARVFDPALLEWVDGRSFRARVFPIPGAGEKRVVLSYVQLLPLADGVYRYVFPMGGGDAAAIQEFSLEADLGDEGENMEVSTLADARIEKDRKLVTMRRSGFTPRSDFLLEMKPKEKREPMRVSRFASGRDEADYVMLRFAPEVAWNEIQRVPGDVVVVLDTSAGGDEADRRIRADAVEAILRALSAGDRFAVISADLTPRVLYPGKGLATADEKNVAAAMERVSEVSPAGATDLGSMFGAALSLVQDAEQPAVVYVGDGLATVGETKADAIAERLRRTLGDSRARVFTIAVGADADTALLERLARVGGGRALRVDTSDEVVEQALAFAGMVKTPTITDLEIDAGAGLDQMFSTAAGKVTEGEEVVVLARTHHALPGAIQVTGRLGGKPFEKAYEPKVESGKDQGFVPALWARANLERLMGEGAGAKRGAIISLGLTYGLMTPFTSFLVLESDAAYLQQGIQRRPRYLPVSDLGGPDDGVEVASGAAAIPLGLFGCSEMKRDESAPNPGGGYSPMQERTRQAVSTPVADMPVAAAAPQAAPPAPTEPAMDGEMAKAEEAPPKTARADELDAVLGGSGVATGSKDTGAIGLGALGTRGTGAGGGGEGWGHADKKGRGDLGTSNRYALRGPADDQARIATGNPYADADANADGAKIFKLTTCSDASRRPLAERRILWSRRLDAAGGAADSLRVYTEAGERCELMSFRERKAMLDLVESRAATAADVQAVLVAFSRYPGAADYLRRRITRRALDPDTALGLYFPSGVDWASVRRGLAALKSPAERVAAVRRALEGRPDDPWGRGLLVEALVGADLTEEARAEAERLKRDGLASPGVLGILCDLDAEAGNVPEAQRVCSELVEFNAKDPAARRELGDLFLRRGWYEAAYRQYRTLVDELASDPQSLLRLAAAAAGMGKVDEALRLERKVASGEGETGPQDPRRFAQLLSAVRLARMLGDAKAANDAQLADSLGRSLKRTQAFARPMTMELLVWEDYAADLDLVLERGGQPLAAAERVAAPAVGLVAIDVGSAPLGEIAAKVALRGVTLRRAVKFSVFTITFDGKAFNVVRRDGEVKRLESETALAAGA